MAQLLGGQLPEVWREVVGARQELVAAAFVLIAASNGVAGLFWRAILATSGIPVTRSAAIASWSASALAKYGLGAPAQYASRAYLAAAGGAPRRRVILGFGLELAAITAAGVVLVLVVAPLEGAAFGVTPVVSWAGPLLALGIVAGLPALLGRASERLPSAWSPGDGERAAGHFRAALLAAMLNWLLVGAALFLLLAALVPVELLLLPHALVAVVVATLSGLYALTPFGLGVREAVMTLLLTPAVPVAAATSAALLHRLGTVLAELVWGVVALLLLRRGRAEA